jgi:DNA-binding protein H-NS
MQIPKEQGQHDQAAQAEQKIPDQVDHQQHADLLAQHGIDPQELIANSGDGSASSGRYVGRHDA